MKLAFGLDFTDLNKIQGLRKLDQIFLELLRDENYLLYQKLLSLRINPNQVDAKYYSDFLLKISPIFDDFLAKLFNIEQEIAELRLTHQEFDIIYECKRKFVQRFAIKKYPSEKLLGINFVDLVKYLENILGINFTEQELARQILLWQLNDEKYATQLDIVAKYSAYMVYNNLGEMLFSLPQKIDQENLINSHKIATYKDQARVGFDYYDPAFNLDNALNAANYCIYCHKQQKDSCSKGLSSSESSLKRGCPLKQKISEMNYVKAKGFNLAALAIIIIDNPMVAATGHRICNDCSNSCIYQKQDPVDIPLIESNILQTTLLLPYGLEIYLLLTNWNPLNIFTPLPKPANNYKILVAGIGPSGFSLCYYLLRDGHNVVAIDGLKIIHLAFDINKPIKYWSDYRQNLSERIPMGFGGVAEYGITARWDKNNLTILQLILQRNERFKLFGGIRIDSNLTIEQALNLGFDHIALCIGAGRPKVTIINNFLAKGVRTASDFLMSLQSTGAFLEKSNSNFLIRMPIIIIGGGLTSLDVATESVIYYKLQVEKFLHKYQLEVMKNGKNSVQQDWTDEERIIAEEFIAHAELFRQAVDKKSIQRILTELGGATIYYRGKLLDSPAYKLNPDELLRALASCVVFVENMIPLAIDIDKYGYAESIEFDNLGVKKKLKARTIIIAIGTENQSNFFNNSYIHKNGNNNYSDDKVTYFGDCDPLYAGSVVKAIASSKEGYKFISKSLASNRPNFYGNYSEFFVKLDYLLTSQIKEVNILADKIIELVISSPLAAKNFSPGQFFRLQNYSNDLAKIIEPLAITGAYVDSDKGLIYLIILETGKSSNLCRFFTKNEYVVLMGPTGAPTEILQDRNIVVVGGGLGNAVLFSIAKAFKNNNCKIIYFAGYKNRQDRFYQDQIEQSSDMVIWCCEEGILAKNRQSDISIKGNVIDGIKLLYSNELNIAKNSHLVDRIIAIGSASMMEAVKDIKDEFFGKETELIVSINSPMQCMMKGICGQCLQKVTDQRKYIFTCACQDQNAEIIDFTGLKNRLEQNSLQEKL
jgi:NADPH-dependent glutamate synthase beta subunit-like oxidoreductase/NAD(P)H-flavin reductase